MDRETADHGGSGTNEAANSICSANRLSSGNPSDSFVVVIRQEEGNSASINVVEKGNSNINVTSDPSSIANPVELRKEPIDQRKKIRDSKDSEDSCVIDVKRGEDDEKIGDNSGGERICRICHLGSDQSCETTTTTSGATARAGLIQLGCGCKAELGIAHGHCAESWFKLRGNRQCEICGEMAKNVMDVGDIRFTEAWNHARSAGSHTNLSDETLASDETAGRCCQRQPFCNFLMACLVMAFVLPWFFRVNMF